MKSDIRLDSVLYHSFPNCWAQQKNGYPNSYLKIRNLMPEKLDE